MAKIRLTSYTFDASAQTVVATQFSDVGLDGIQLITNVTDNIIIYQFNDPAKGGSLSTDTLTLDYDTTTMDDSDKLMVLVEDGTASSGGGTEYTEGDTDASITGTAILWEDGSDTLRAVSSAKPLPTAIISALPAGTAAIGKLAANSGVDIGDVDVTSLPALAAGTNAIGKLLPPDVDVTTHTNYAKKYYTNSGAVTDGIVWSPAAGKRWHVVSMFVQTSAAATVTFEDDKAGGDEVVMKMELAANSGVSIPWSEKYPLASGEDAADLLVTTSAGNIYITVTGYEI